MNKQPRRHHFSPEFYLRGFCRDGMLWLYDRKKGEFRTQPPNKTAVEKDYYSFQDESGQKDTRVENYLSLVETKANEAIRKLEAQGDLGAEERLNLAQFITFLMVRTPKFDQNVNEIRDQVQKLTLKQMVPTVEAAANFLNAHSKTAGEPKISPESLFEFIHEERFTVQTNRNFVINAMLDQVQKATFEVATMDWVVVRADKRGAFITTDQPIGFIVPEEFRQSGEPALGLCSEKITKIVPLSQSIALMIAGHKSCGLAHIKFNREQIRYLNISVATECDRYVIGRDEALVRSIVKQSEVDSAAPGSLLKVEHLVNPTDPSRTFFVTRRVAAADIDRPVAVVLNDENGPINLQSKSCDKNKK